MVFDGVQIASRGIFSIPYPIDLDIKISGFRYMYEWNLLLFWKQYKTANCWIFSKSFMDGKSLTFV